MRKNKTIFITATDTNVGKTVTTLCLGVLLKAQGYDIGVMKPVQCAGDDIQFLSKALNIADEMPLLNPFFAKEPLSPHLALRRAKIKFDKRPVLAALKVLQARHEVVLVEGAGGLMVPLSDKYYNIDLIRDMKAEVIIVARLGLGTINHTFLTINQAKAYGLTIKGLVFCDTNPRAKTLAERTNPTEIAQLSGIKVLGVIPYLKPLTTHNILKQCKHLKLKP
jgi:dethiobiotin synthetase